MNEEIQYSPKGQRKLSTFFGKEFLYDYAAGELDHERRVALENFLQTNKEAQVDLQKIRMGVNYAEMLNSIEIDESLLTEIKTPTSYVESFANRIQFHQWPKGVRLALESLVIAIGISAIAIVIPWYKIKEVRFMSGQDVILAELIRDSKVVAEPEKKLEQADDQTFPDESIAAAPSTTIVAGKNVITTTTQVVAAKAPPTTAAKTATPTTLVTVASQLQGAEAAADAKRQGWLYRGEIKINNVTAINPKLVEKLTSLGGRKAGGVPIGWRKGSGSYFHFTIPEGKLDEVLSTFNSFGALKIQKEKHDRIMPEGIIRLIITVDEAGKPAETELPLPKEDASAKSSSKKIETKKPQSSDQGKGSNEP